MKRTYRAGSLEIRVPSDGYFVVAVLGQKYTGSKVNPDNYRLLVSCEDREIQYFFTDKSLTEVFPFQFGEGDYYIRLYKRVQKNSFQRIADITIRVTLKNPNSPFLCANQYVSMEPGMNDENLDILKNSKDKIEAVKNFITKNFKYDSDKAKLVANERNGVPDIEGLLLTKKGTCLDIAALTAAYMRMLNIPAKLVIGYFRKRYHAWCEYFDGEKGKWIRFDPTGVIQKWKTMKDNWYVEERVF